MRECIHSPCPYVERQLRVIIIIVMSMGRLERVHAVYILLLIENERRGWGNG